MLDHIITALIATVVAVLTCMLFLSAMFEPLQTPPARATRVTQV